MKQPQVGVGVIVRKKDKILLCKRNGSHGMDTWGFPGGKLEYGETIINCAVRETAEEAGIAISNPVVAAVTDDIFENEEKHYVTIFVVCDYASGDVTIMEPDKCAAWEWYSWDNLPNPLFLPIINLLKQNFDPFSTL